MGQLTKVVGETGFAPARNCFREFLRLECLLFHHSPKTWCSWCELHAHAFKGQRGLSPPCILVPTTGAKWVPEERLALSCGFQPRRVLRPLCIHSTIQANGCPRRD